MAFGDVASGDRLCCPRQVAQDEGPLHHEADFRDRRDGSPEENAGEPSIEKADSLNIRPRQYRSKRAAEDVGGGEENEELETERYPAQVTMQSQPKKDVYAADDEQEAPPDRNRI